METEATAPQDWRGGRRMQALHPKQQGWKKRDIAAAIDVNPAGRRPGAPPHLSVAQRARIPEFLWHGAEAYGFRGDVWTCARVARVIAEEFAVTYSKSHVSRLLRALEWSPQIPIRRALQRDEAAITHWRDAGWPPPPEHAPPEGRPPPFAGETGLPLLPRAVK